MMGTTITRTSMPVFRAGAPLAVSSLIGVFSSYLVEVSSYVTLSATMISLLSIMGGVTMGVYGL